MTRSPYVNLEKKKLSDIFISYKREEQEVAKRLAAALESHGWSVWWDPKLRAGEHFDDVIEKALKESRCVIVLWSKLSVESRYVKAEATYALNLDKLVPVAIEDMDVPFRFAMLHTPRLTEWNGAENNADYLRLVEDIASKIGKPSKQTTDKEETPDIVVTPDVNSTSGVTPAQLIQFAEELDASRAEALHPQKALDEKEIPQSLSMTPGEVFCDLLQDGSEGPEMVVIPVGKFWMGSDEGYDEGYYEDRPRHEVMLAKPFALGRYAVTFEEYDRFVSETGRELPDDVGWGRGRRPVINVSWDDAKAYTQWLSEQTGEEYRLSTEAEWEYASRAGTTTEYWWGDGVGNNNANCNGCGSQWDFKRTAPVGSFKPNPFGLYDSLGNAWEWMQDCYVNTYKGAPTDGSARESRSCSQRVLRGCSWGDGSHYLRSATRSKNRPVYRNNYVGFRLARTL